MALTIITSDVNNPTLALGNRCCSSCIFTHTQEYREKKSRYDIYYVHVALICEENREDNDDSVSTQREKTTTTSTQQKIKKPKG